MRCPACQTTLVVVEREGIEIDWCVECGGLWFDEGEMELLGEKAGRRFEAEDLGRRAEDAGGADDRRCPRCPRRMERLTLSPGKMSGRDAAPIEIDRCPDHGIWLDRGELGRIMRRLAPRPTSQPYESDEGLMMSFLGETFVATADAPAAPPERREE